MTKAEREAIQTAFELIADGADPIDLALSGDFDCELVARAANALRELAVFRVTNATDARIAQLEYRVWTLEAR